MAEFKPLQRLSRNTNRKGAAGFTKKEQAWGTGEVWNIYALRDWDFLGEHGFS